MDLAYLHIVTNHIPIIGVPFALFLLVLGIWRKSDELKSASFLFFAFLGIATLVVYLLGQGGEDFVEELAGVSHDAIENHEDFAKIALATVIGLALLSAFALIRYRGLQILKRRYSQKLLNGNVLEITGSYFPKWIVFSVLALAFTSIAVLGYTGKLGGMIRHTEFYSGVVTSENEENNSEQDKTDREQKDTEKESEKGRGRGRNRGKN